MKKVFYGIIGAIAFMLFAVNVSAAEISEVNITIAAPKAGDKITIVDYKTTPVPTVTLGDNSYAIDTLDGKAIWLKKLPSQATSDPSDYVAIDEEIHYYEDGEVTFEEGKDYYVEVPIVVSNPDEDSFSSSVVVKVNGITEGFETNIDPEHLDYSSHGFIVYAKVTAIAGEGSGSNDSSSSSSSTAVTYTTLEGASQKFNTTSGKALTFRFDVDYSKFESNGKVYVDGKLVASSNYTSKSGSTIIVFNKAYVKKLANGKHTLTVDFGDGTASTDFTITGNPNTGDNVYVYIIALIVAIFGLGYARQKSNNNA